MHGENLELAEVQCA